jgi:predicted O-linked N-acetylglucosamine transferase (SPINDLY family)
MPSNPKNIPNSQSAPQASLATEQSQLKNAVALHQQGRIQEAQAIYESILNSNPKNFDALHLLGVAAMHAHNYQLAVDLIGKAIAIYNKNSDFYCNRGIALRALKQLNAAIASYDQAIRLKPDNAGAHYNRGIALYEAGKFATALASYDRAIQLKANFAAAYSNRGLALQELKRFDAAIASYDKAISLKPDYAEAYCNRGNTLRILKQLEASVASYDKAININPNYADAYSNRGVALFELKQLNAAITSCERALNIDPNHTQAHFNMGHALQELKRLNDAIASFNRAISIKPDFAEAYSSRGNALQELKQFDAAVESYNQAITFKPNYDYLAGILLHTKMKLCDWTHFDRDVLELTKKINANEKVSPGFAVQGLVSSLSVQRKVSEIWVNDMYPFNPILGAIPKLKRSNKIRIAYYSADFHNHATSYLMAELFEKHDKNKFELFAFSFGPDEKDEMRQRVAKAFDQFIDVRTKSDKAIAQLSRELGIDIAIDLKGYTTDARTGIFAYRAAPIQVNYLGFPGTMGADYIDYLIADRTLIPPEGMRYFSEKIVYLPNSYQVNDRKKLVSDKVFSRAELGLPAEGFVFCCFNNNFKITPAVFDSWIRILNSVQGSVLWLFEDNPTSAINLSKEAEKRGLDSKRIVYAKKMKLSEHLARHKVANLFLDTLPYNAHTTASDALWAGLPVLTCIGESFPGRVAASLLNAIKLPELITNSTAEYEALAIELATHPAKLQVIQDKLQANKLTSPLFNADLFTKHIEDAYTQIYARYQSDFPPEHLYIIQD